VRKKSKSLSRHTSETAFCSFVREFTTEQYYCATSDDSIQRRMLIASAVHEVKELGDALFFAKIEKSG
jgi:hypothetical protein